MGCASTTAQTDNVVSPSHNYIETKGAVNNQVPVLPSIEKEKEGQKIQKEEEKGDRVVKNEDEGNENVSLNVGNSPESKKEEERVMTASTQELKHEPMKHVPQGKAFIFGQSENERKIVLFDCQKMQFSILSSRSQSPNPPHKYQPKQIIFEQSQEMLASNLFNMNSHPPYNFMFITFISDQTIFLCGGVNYQFDYVSEEAFLFRVASISNEEVQTRRNKLGNNLVGNKFQKLNCMKNKRFSHMGAYFKLNTMGYIYVFGGRGENEELLSSCEQYSIEQKKWRQMTPMKIGRSTGFSLIFQSKIYVFGGYTGDMKRSKVIQVYDPFKNYWEVLNVKLHRGIEAGLLFSAKANQILVMGGNMQLGSLKSVIKINLVDETYVWDSNMKNGRMLQKGVKLNDLIYVFGGDSLDTFEKYGVKDRKWKDHQFSFNQYISVEDVNSYQMATQTLEVQYDQSVLSKMDQVGEYEKYLIFGNDNYPCILELNVTKWVLKKKVVPMALRLRSNMGVVRVMEGKYFLCGGIDSFGEKPSRASYIYYTGTNKAIEVDKMSSKKYEFTICGNNKHVYLFGGRSQGGEILRECEKYSFEEQRWVQLPGLPSERAGGKAIMVGSKILLFGGVDTLQTVTSVDIFDTESDTFWHSKQSLSIPAELKAVFLDEKQTPGVYLFFFNEVLAKYFSYYLLLNIPDKNEEVEHQKIQGNFSLVKDVEQKQINIKLVPFIHSFFHQNRISFITAKGLFHWQPNHSEKSENKVDSQIVINQVEMLQYPIEKFSVV